MRLLRKILFPFSLLYAGIMFVRNKFYDWGIFSSHQFELPIICVGNLSVGGTGKSPMIEFLISFLKDSHRLASLSRGYKRETKGFHLLTGAESAREVGDEPLQFKSKFPEVRVAVDEQRVHGIKKLLALENPPEVILLDDAFQHRKVRAGLNILLTSYGNLYSEDHVLPTGNLRESRAGAERAQLVVVTKCPDDLSSSEKEDIKDRLRLDEAQQLYFSGISYGKKIFSRSESFELDRLRGKELTLVTGIANPRPLLEYLSSQGIKFRHLTFPDHHNFSNADIAQIKKAECILTTEKDFMRLKGELDHPELYYLPMEMKFLSAGGKANFEKAVRTFLKKK